MCHRITEWFVLEGTLETILFQQPCHGQGCHLKDQVAQGPINISEICLLAWVLK